MSLAAAPVVFLVVVSVGVGDHASSTAKPNGRSARMVAGATCKEQPTRVACKDIEANGRIWRYALLQADTPTADTVVVDFGGPGQTVLSGVIDLQSFRAAYPSLSTRFNLLVLEEPWVTEELTDDCEGALTGFYLALRTAPLTADRQGADLVRRCEVNSGGRAWGFQSAAYAGLVRAVEQRDHLTVRGFVGHSWGAARLAYLDSAKLDFAALIRPFPLGADADHLVAARVRKLAEMAGDTRGDAHPTDARDRSLPVTRFDEMSAQVELAYVDDPFFAANAAGVLNGADRVLIGTLSDKLWGRYGRDSVSPALLAQLQEICPTTGPTSGSTGEITSVQDVLAAQFSPCRAIARTSAATVTARKTCVVSSALDAVAPGDLAATAYRGNAVQWVDVPNRSHGSFDGLEICLKTVLPSR
jgi:hypothetical protein